MAGKRNRREADTGLTIHTTFRVPRELHERLTDAAAKVEGRGIGEEIRARLEESFIREFLSDEKTRALTFAIHKMEREVRPTYGRWHQTPFAFEVFKASVTTLLGYFRPKGEPVPPPTDPDSPAAVFYGLDATPETAGRIIAARATMPIAGILGLPGTDELVAR